MRKSPKFSPEVIERAVRMVFDAKDQYPSQWAAIESIAGKIGCTAETLRKWVRQGERDSGVRPGWPTARGLPGGTSGVSRCEATALSIQWVVPDARSHSRQ